MTRMTATSSTDVLRDSGAAGGGVVGPHGAPAAIPADPAPGRSDHGVAARRDADPDDTERRGPGRPRSARADEAIIEAVLDLLGEASIEALSIEAVAARAGVGKATIYRRWPNKEALVIDAIAAIKGTPPVITGADVRDDLVTLLRPMAQAHNTRAGRILPCLIPEIQRNPELYSLYQKLLAPRRTAIRDVLTRGIEDGQLRPDMNVEVTVALLVSPMIVQTMLRLQPELDLDKLPEQIVDGVLPGVRA
jgi:AcrR family transcriptional regulator